MNVFAFWKDFLKQRRKMFCDVWMQLCSSSEEDDDEIKLGSNFCFSQKRFQHFSQNFGPCDYQSMWLLLNGNIIDFIYNLLEKLVIMRILQILLLLTFKIWVTFCFFFRSILVGWCWRSGQLQFVLHQFTATPLEVVYPSVSTILQNWVWILTTPSLLCFFKINKEESLKNLTVKFFCRWQDSNRGPLESEATALPTEPQPLPSMINFKLLVFGRKRRK